MKITMLTGSPHMGGTSALLAENYVSGAVETGHEVLRFDTGRLEIHPCTGCDHCRGHGGKCVYSDAMTKISPALLMADRVVLVTPLYYFGMTAQLKSAIDRFYAINGKLREDAKSLELLAVCGDRDEWAMDALLAHCQIVSRYLGWGFLPPLLAYGFYTRKGIEASDFALRARARGRQETE